MRKEIEKLIKEAELQLDTSIERVRIALIQIKSAHDLGEGHPAYDDLAKHGYMEDYCRGRISGFKQVLEILARP